MAAAFSYPTAILSALLMIVVFYWLLALIGLVDFETGGGVDLDIDADPDLHVDGDATDISVLASYMVALGLNGVPFSVVVSLLVLISWTVSCLLAEWLLPWMPITPIRYAIGTGVLLVSIGFAILLTARIVRPMRKLFVSHSAISNASIVGQTCKVVTGSVSETFGRAEVATQGTPLNIRVWARTPNLLCKGSSARIVDYEEGSGRYEITAES